MVLFLFCCPSNWSLTSRTAAPRAGLAGWGDERGIDIPETCPQLPLLKITVHIQPWSLHWQEGALAPRAPAHSRSLRSSCIKV